MFFESRTATESARRLTSTHVDCVQKEDRFQFGTTAGPACSMTTPFWLSTQDVTTSRAGRQFFCIAACRPLRALLTKSKCRRCKPLANSARKLVAEDGPGPLTTAAGGHPCSVSAGNLYHKIMCDDKFLHLAKAQPSTSNPASSPTAGSQSLRSMATGCGTRQSTALRPRLHQSAGGGKLIGGTVASSSIRQWCPVYLQVGQQGQRRGTSGIAARCLRHGAGHVPDPIPSHRPARLGTWVRHGVSKRSAAHDGVPWGVVGSRPGA